MNSEKHYNNLNLRFINYWSKRRSNKLKYTFLNTSFFAIPLSMVLSFTNYGLDGLLSSKSLVLFLLTFIIYGLFVYFVEFRLNEKRFQKLIKESKDFDKQ